MIKWCAPGDQMSECPFWHRKWNLRKSFMVISLTFWVHDGHLGDTSAGLGGAVGGAEGWGGRGGADRSAECRQRSPGCYNPMQTQAGWANHTRWHAPDLLAVGQRAPDVDAAGIPPTSPPAGWVSL